MAAARSGVPLQSRTKEFLLECARSSQLSVETAHPLLLEWLVADASCQRRRALVRHQPSSSYPTVR